MTPKHIKFGPKDRKAIAPYNFVELPDSIVTAEEPPSSNCYDKNRYTGRIKCVITTDSPLYIRCGMTPENFAKFGAKSDDEFSDKDKNEKRKTLADFFQHPTTQHPVIPGSSLRGMLRTLVEIAGYGKLTKISDQQRFFFRAVAAEKDDPLKYPYKELIKNVKAGYLVKRGEQWFIRPAKTKVSNLSFIWVKESSLSSTDVPNLMKMNQVKDYQPQHILVNYNGSFIKNGRTFAENVSENIDAFKQKGMLVTSGNMLESSDNANSSNRKNHCLIFEENKQAEIIQIDEKSIEDYCTSLTDFQKKPPFDKEKGVLKDGGPIFYCEPQGKESKVTRFGHSPYFRIAYIPKGSDRAASVIDFIPSELTTSKGADLDLAEAIFGFVKNEKQEDNQARAGRVFVSDAICQKKESDDIWWTGDFTKSVTPQILAGPKPTTFQHYLVQPNSERRKLKHYGSTPGEETMIRGHKLYWHKGNSPSIQLDNPQDVSESQTTEIKPIKPGVSFKFTLDFENLSQIELGALLWILKIAGDQDYRLSLGMGKPLGMGAIAITHELWLSDRTARYSSLFQDEDWATGDRLATGDESEKYINAFEDYIVTQLKKQGESYSDFNTIPRIKMLLAMLSWPGPSSEETRYMEIERDVRACHIGQPRNGAKTVNEYQERPVLPTPLQIMGGEDAPIVDRPRPSPKNSGGKKIDPPQQQPKPTPQLKKTSQNSEKGKSEKNSGLNLATQRPPTGK
ncbi:TIGR03986 family CRISPR-associated RAMP protein [Phormidium pseudopriestleyi FRX01]|uniref:TIGR03986 family CRISPR-associated RAMP protein n=1 Tax=Phormidium pseudopriestleyi FRX01 TaxID=1759528 RepID=A0ABS3FN21_9CYAN|nr:TIGR03986 family CRISPR-associated RAMP protein [Phormidium pseudopriestleyi]MBO0348510.1 TIGR03986 family CRISPR-associated RAMP protein [Phormidium pseudopriestleyi FRX01]